MPRLPGPFDGLGMFSKADPGLEHCNMIRGLVPKERLLEWHIDDGWDPLCKFLGKPVPDMEFPRVNTATGGWKAREEQCTKRWVVGAFRRLFFAFCLLVAGIAIWWKYPNSGSSGNNGL